MRTVVFSDERIALAFNARFVSAWENQNWNTKFSDYPPKPEKYIYQPDEDLPLGTGDTNVISVFATPQGHILNAVSGYLSVDALFDEMRLALAVRELTMDGDYKLKPGASRSFVGLHRAAAELCGASVAGRAHRRLAWSGMGVFAKNIGAEYAEARSKAFHRLLESSEPKLSCKGFSEEQECFGP